MSADQGAVHYINPPLVAFEFEGAEPDRKPMSGRVSECALQKLSGDHSLSGEARMLEAYGTHHQAIHEAVERKVAAGGDRFVLAGDI